MGTLERLTVGTRRRSATLWGRTPQVFVCLFFAGAVGPLSAQTFQGRVLDDQDDRPVATALVRLVDEDGDQQTVSAADSAGFYRIYVPEPGVYRLEADRLGYEPFATPLLEALDPDGIYPLDLLMRRSPLPIRGLTVSAERVDRRIRLLLGVNPASLRERPIRFDAIQDHLGRNHDLSEVLRWSNTANLLVYRTVEGPCYTLRRRACLPVYFNGMYFRREFIDAVPLDMVHTIQLLYPGESLTYPEGAVLMFSEAWLR